MDLSFNGKMEAYYQKFIELQEKLRKSEEERLKLEMKFNEMLQTSREEEQAHYRKLRAQYKKFLEEDKKRQERNERIVRTLERIEARVNMLTSRTDRFKMLKRQYQSYLQRISHMKPIDKTEHPPKIEEDTPHEQRKRDILEHHANIPDHSSLKKAMGKSNEEKIEILDKYLQNLATQKRKDTVENEEKEPQSDLSQLRYLDNISKKMEDGFNSNQANSIAEDIMNSIYSRHYKKDLFNDETMKASKFTTPNYLNNDIPLKQNSSDFNDSYPTKSALENLGNNGTIGKDLSVDETYRNRPTSNYEDNIGVIRNKSEFDRSNKNNYSLRDNIPKSLRMYDKQVDNEEIERDKARKQILENGVNTLSKSKDYYIEAAPFGKSTDYRSKNEQYETNNYTKNDSEYPKSNQNQRQVDPSLTDYRTIDFASNDYLKTNQVQSQVDPSLKSMEYRNKEKDHESKDFTTNDSEHLKPVHRVKFEENSDMAYGPSKAETDTIETEKQVVDNYIVPSRNRDKDADKLSNDTCEKQVVAIQREIDHSKYEQTQEHHDTEFTDNEKYNGDGYLTEQCDDTIINSQNPEELYNTKQENDSSSLINNEREVDTIIPNQQFDDNEPMYDNEGDIKELVADVQNIPKYELNNDVQNSEEIQSENKAPIQYNQLEEPMQYDQFGNQIIYDESGQVPPSQYDENGQLYNQSESYDEAGQQLYDENRLDVQYNENGQFVPPYDQQYAADGQPILYDQQYDTSGQPVQQLYDENGQVFQQYDQSGQPIPSYDQNSHPVQYDENGGLMPQYDENGQLIEQYDDSGQPIHLYGQSDQRTEYDENSHPIQENEQLIEQYNQDIQSVPEHEQPLQHEHEQPVEQYNEGNQLVQEYEQSFQQYDANGQLIQQYDENGQPIYQYDENVQPIQQYDENGQLIHHYDESTLHQYNENDQPPAEYVEQSQPIQQHGENVELSQGVPILEAYDKQVEEPPENTNMNQTLDRNDENLEEEKSNTDSSKSTVKEDINSPMVIENNESQPAKQKNVLDMLDTDTESVKQSTSKISNDSDFDFSNG